MLLGLQGGVRTGGWKYARVGGGMMLEETRGGAGGVEGCTRLCVGGGDDRGLEECTRTSGEVGGLATERERDEVGGHSREREWTQEKESERKGIARVKENKI